MPDDSAVAMELLVEPLALVNCSVMPASSADSFGSAFGIHLAEVVGIGEVLGSGNYFQVVAHGHFAQVDRT